MRKLIVTSTLILIVTLNSTFAQSDTYFGIEGAMTHDLFSYFDDGDRLISKSIISHYVGFKFSFPISNNLSFETGLLRKQYYQGYDYRYVPKNPGVTTNAFNCLQIPLRFKTFYPVYKNRIFISALIGYNIGIRSGTASEGSGIEIMYLGNDTISSSFNSHSGLAKSFSLLETGLGISYKFCNESKISLNASYFTGFTNTIEMNITYSVDEASYYNATGISKGDYWAIGLEYTYPLKRKSNI